MKKIGVFICHCGINIAGTVDVKRVAEVLVQYPGVIHSVEYKYMCSDPGQQMVRDAIKEKGLEGVVVAACSPTLHELTFRRACLGEGLNPYQCEMANIREHCSWVHTDEEKATQKAIKIIQTIVEKVKGNESLVPIGVPITRRALVVGGGISGMQAALDIANSGYEVILVEKDPSIGGHMAQLSETFPTLDCSQCILTPKMVETGQHSQIKLLTYSEIDDVSGHVGNFTVKIRRKSAYVDWTNCNGCGLCQEKCPVKIDSEFDRGLGKRKAIYIPFPQAVPNKPVIDKALCQYFLAGKCRVCEKICPVQAVNFEQQDTIVEEKVGAIVVATGYDLYAKDKLGEYGAGKIKDVIDGLQFERLLSASGPTGGEVRRPSDGKVPKEVVFVQCVGSRDPDNALPYCSKICCMYTVKHAMLYKHRVHEGQPYIFYIDIRSGGKGYEEFVERGVKEDGILYLRGKVSKIFAEGDKVIVWGADTLTNKKIEIAADLVVLAQGMIPNPGVQELAKKLRISVDANGFLNEAHPKLRPVETMTLGVYLAGAAQAPKDIPEAVAQASGAASKVVSLFSTEELHHEPIVAGVNEDLCCGCAICVPVCPYGARELDAEKKIVKVTEVLCEGCGACTAACPTGAAQQKNLADKQVFAMTETGAK
ncbi:MAG: CoB--CoM heterodisulfide reductase iron-sulfur subunit A family protein [Candidatus Edwardsbacteria bacterium]